MLSTSTFNPKSLTQAAWFVDAVNGNDSHDGSVGSPLQTFAEIQRRFGPSPELTQSTVINLLSPQMVAGDQEVLDNLAVQALGTQTLTIQGTVFPGANLGPIVAVSPINHAVADGGLKVTIAGAWPAKNTRVRILGGARDGAIAYVNTPNIAAGQARLSPFATQGPALPALVTPQQGDVLIVETTTQFQRPLLMKKSEAKIIHQDIEFLDDGSGQWISMDAGLLPRFTRCYFHGGVHVSSSSVAAIFSICQFQTGNFQGVFSLGTTLQNMLACHVDATDGAGVEGFWQIDLDTMIDGGGTGNTINSNYHYLALLGDVAIYNAQAGGPAIFVQVGTNMVCAPIFSGSHIYGTGNDYAFFITGGSRVQSSDATLANILIVGTTSFAKISGVNQVKALYPLDATQNSLIALA